MLQQKDDLMDGDINIHQNLADDFYCYWIDHVGYDGITDYYHIIGADIFHYFLLCWRNLYDHLQRHTTRWSHTSKIEEYKREEMCTKILERIG